MVYDPGKYLEKRQKVLGEKKRGPGFGTLAGIVSAAIILGLSAVTVPRAVTYMSIRHQDDAIFKLEADNDWPDAIIEIVTGVKGIEKVAKDKNQTRLTVTFDRRLVQLSQIETIIKKHGLEAVLLNRMNHYQHKSLLGTEEEH